MGTETLQVADPAGFLESNLPLVESVLHEVARRQRVRGDALDELRSLGFLKLVEHDYAVLRRFAGASSLRTYLSVVLHRVLLDHRNREWGRWRASAAASRRGPVAVQLERLITRDGLSPCEAIAAVGTQGSIRECLDFVSALGHKVPSRGSRATLGGDAIPESPDPAPGPDAGVELRERAERAERLCARVRAVLRALPVRDHLLVTLRYRDGLSIQDAARVLGVDAKPLYRRLDRILAHLKTALAVDRLPVELVRESWCDSLPGGESGWWRQSIPPSGPDSDPADLVRERVPGLRAARRVHRRPALGPRPDRGAASL